MISAGQGKKYLEIGCGTGNYMAEFAAHSLDMTGVDPSDVMLDAVRAAHPDLSFVSGRAENIPFPDQAFDRVIAGIPSNSVLRPLSEQIRSNTSAFRLFCNSAELEDGLRKLSADIQSGRIRDVMQSFENDLGDYLFFSALRL